MKIISASINWFLGLGLLVRAEWVLWRRRRWLAACLVRLRHNRERSEYLWEKWEYIPARKRKIKEAMRRELRATSLQMSDIEHMIQEVQELIRSQERTVRFFWRKFW